MGCNYNRITATGQPRLLGDIRLLYTSLIIYLDKHMLFEAY